MQPLKARIVSLLRKVPPLHHAVWKLRQGYHWCNRRLSDRRSVVDGVPLLERALEKSEAFAIGKMGSVEASAAKHYLRRISASAKVASQRSYPAYIRETLFMNAGVFPAEDVVFDGFSSIYLKAVSELNALVAWSIAGEAEIFSRHSPNASLVPMRCLEPFFLPIPWTRLLAERKVLVISPFADTITRQYSKRCALWDNPQMLPRFELKTIRAPLSAGLVAPESGDWFEALTKMQMIMNEIDFDVALVGAGAYSLPLAAHAKRLGKIGIHLGGVLQIMFGIVGARWERKSDFAVLIKPSWCRPSGSETPTGVQRVEQACYW